MYRIQIFPRKATPQGDAQKGPLGPADPQGHWTLYRRQALISCLPLGSLEGKKWGCLPQ